MWTIKKLAEELNANQEIREWRIFQNDITRRERYFLSNQKIIEVDQDRSSKAQNITAEIMTRGHSRNRQGQIRFKFFIQLDMKKQIMKAIQLAQQVDVEFWALPTEIQKSNRELKTADPEIMGDPESILNRLSVDLEKNVTLFNNQKFNSAEIFLSKIKKSMYLSNGLIYQNVQSQIYTEAAFSGLRGKHSDEFLQTQWAVHQDQLDMKELISYTHQNAGNILNVKPPKTGKYCALIDQSVLMGLFHSCLGQLSASNQYQKLPHKKIGDDFIPDPKGDLVHLSLDPFFDFGADTTAYSADGILQKEIKLIEANNVQNIITTKQYADYLKLDPTPCRGTLRLRPGTRTKEELIRSEHKVLEICQFSAMFYNHATCTFSSEIRLAKLHDRDSGKVEFIKGGSLSGSLFENFANVNFSKETAYQMDFSSFGSDSGIGEGYYGPKYALIRDVSIAH